jgi:hypothetical protein
MLPIAGELLFLALVMLFDETFAAFALASLYPVPEGPVRPRILIKHKVPPTMITISGNDVEVQNADGVAGSCALLFASDVTSVKEGQDDSLIVANNRFRARTPQPDIPAAFVWYFGRCAMHGNLISDVPVAGDAATSLHLYADGLDNNSELPNKANTALLSVVGNVFEGTTNLSELARADAGKLGVAPPLNTWVYWNANA